MQRETQIRLTRRALDFIAADSTELAAEIYRHPVAAYHSPERLAKETEILFRQGPVMLGPSLRIPKRGDYFTDDNTGVPILVARGEDDQVRAFLNVCRHRGTRLTEGCGHGSSFVCPYHAWTYGLDGRLKVIPEQRRFPGVDTKDHGLVQLAAAERHGMIWVKPRPSETGETELDIAGYLGATVDSEFSSYDLAHFHLYESRQVPVKANWKLLVDTFLEPYHFKMLHAKTVAKVFIPNLSLFEPLGPHLRACYPRHSMREQKDVPESEWDLMKHSAIVYVLFPNVAVLWQLDHMEVWRLFPVPGKVDESVAYLDFLSPHPIETDSARGHWKRSLDLTVATVLEEDFACAEGIQRGLTSGAMTHTQMGLSEPALAFFERTVSETVEGPPRAGSREGRR